MGSSKIKIRTSSWHKTQLALYHDEVRILIFDDPAEFYVYERKRPQSGSWEVNCQTRAAAPHALNLVPAKTANRKQAIAAVL